MNVTGASSTETTISDKHNLCAMCLKTTDAESGSFLSCCRDGISVSPLQLNDIRRGIVPTFPKFEMTAQRKEIKKATRKPRTGTMKAKARELWEKGYTVAKAYDKMTQLGIDAKETSLRCWWCQFKQLAARG